MGIKLDHGPNLMPAMVEVCWVDSSSSAEWFTPAQREWWSKSECLCYSSGYLQSKNDKEIVLFVSWRRNGNTGGLWSIPVACVKWMKIIKRPFKLKPE